MKATDIVINDDFKAISLLDIDFEGDEVISINVKYTWKSVNEEELEKLMIFFYNKIMDDNAKLEIHSDFDQLDTDTKIKTLKAMFDRKEYLCDESIFETLILLTKVDPVLDQDNFQSNVFKDFVEFVDIKLALAQDLSNITRDLIIYYMSLIAGITGNRVLHVSTLNEMFITTRRGLEYFGELLTSFALSSQKPISNDELYIIQNRDAIYSSMLLASTISNSLNVLESGLLSQESE